MIDLHDSNGYGECGAPLRLRSRLLPALEELFDASAYARDLQCDRWWFGLTFEELRGMKLTRHDLLWLLCKGLVECSNGHSLGCQIPSGHPPTFDAETLFVLSEQGLRDVSEVFGRLQPPPSPRTQTRPEWDPERHELRLGTDIVKRFRWPAVNQETVLVSFAEESWPPRIDDPLPPQHGIVAKRRLNDTIKCLNRNQIHRLIRFRGDGTGTGILWEPTTSAKSLVPCV